LVYFLNTLKSFFPCFKLPHFPKTNKVNPGEGASDERDDSGDNPHG